MAQPPSLSSPSAAIHAGLFARQAPSPPSSGDASSPACLSAPTENRTAVTAQGGSPLPEAGAPQGNRALLRKPEKQLGPSPLPRASVLWFTLRSPRPPKPAAPSPPGPLRGHRHLPMYEHPNSEPAARICPSLQTPSAGPSSSKPYPRPWSPGPCFLSPAREDYFTDAPQKQDR